MQRLPGADTSMFCFSKRPDWPGDRGATIAQSYGKNICPTRRPSFFTTPYRSNECVTPKRLSVPRSGLALHHRALEISSRSLRSRSSYHLDCCFWQVTLTDILQSTTVSVPHMNLTTTGSPLTSLACQ